MRRRRQGKKAGGGGHERWLVSYADFITLLFAFFTSMYAISSVNEAKYRAVSGALSSAFSSAAVVAARPAPGPGTPEDPGGRISERFKETFSRKYRSLARALKGISGNAGVHLIMEDDSIIVRLPAGTFFAPGSASLTGEARAALSRMAPALKGLESEIRIEGHTDDIPINNKTFRSNWDLSSARAMSVLKFLVNNFDIDPLLVSATGYGEFRPVASNDTPSGRKKNRRVDIVVER